MGLKVLNAVRVGEVAKVDYTVNVEQLVGVQFSAVFVD